MRTRRIPEAIAFFAPLGLYLATLAPTIHLGDSGELTVAGALLGVAHVPGYPLLTQLTHLAAQLPLGHIAWRANFMSALFGALAVWATYRLLLEITGRRWASLAAALTLATTYTLWEQSLKIRAYPLNTFFAAAVIYLTLRWRATADKRFLFTAFALCGVGLGNHEILLVVVAVPGVLMLAHRRQLRLVDWLLCGVLATVGVTLYLYLPLRAAANPALNWGDPSTLSRFLDALLQRQYSHKMLNADWAAKGEMLLVIARSFTDELGLVAFALGAGGLIALGRRDRALTAGLLLLVAGNIALRINYIGEDEMFQVRRYLISTYLVIVIGLAYTLAWLERRVSESPRRPWLRAAFGALLVLIVAWPLLHHLRANQQQGNWVAYEAWQNTLAHPEPEYGLFVGGDNNVFPLWYLQMAERRRPTVSILPRGGFRADWMIEMMALQLPADVVRSRPEFSGAAYEDPLFLSTVSNLLEYREFPFAMVFDNLQAPADNLALSEMSKRAAPFHAGALTWWANPSSADRQRVWRFYQTAAITDPDLPRDHHTQTVATDYGAYFDRLARDLEGAGDARKAVEAYARALAADPQNDASMANLGNLYARLGEWPSAVFWYERALEIAPEQWQHHHNLAIIFEAMGETEKAAAARTRAGQLQSL
ncbi:MAG: DUF2723 domain-containing protein [Candidatus Lernaella stagnicola]|nr:DUF2723 domain-containing protein [Candidatus Lernaella stagnicola]